jgi:hypothetical protein
MSTTIEKKPNKKGGRPPGINLYVDVTYGGKEYTVGFVEGSLLSSTFVIDREDFPKIRDLQIHRTSNVYVSSSVYIDGTKKELAVHNIVMNRYSFNGKGQSDTVDHISRNGFDNRKENLRIASCSEQMYNQRKRRRNVDLPKDCGIIHDDIPRHIWYVKANGAHGDRFAVEFIPKNFLWRSTSSKSVPLRTKLEEAKQKLAECYTLYPELDPHNPEWLAKQKELNDSYEAIVAIANASLLSDTPLAATT